MLSDRASLPDLFAQALELDEPGRRLLLDSTLREDAALGRALARLLANLTERASPLDRSPWRSLGAGDPAPASPPMRIGPYEVVRELGRGGMARVYLAEERTDLFVRLLAVKVLERAPFDERSERRFRDEVRILSSLDHPGIARFLHGGRTEDGAWFFALEHVDGEDLLAWARARSLPVRARVQLFLEALEALAYAHARGVVHRDLKPAHLLIDTRGRSRLLDFGISRLVDPETGEALATTGPDSRALTPAYASPEQFRGETATPASDVYSLGAILYELLSGRRPFAELEGERTRFERAVLDQDPDRPSEVARRFAVHAPGTESDAAVWRFGALARDLDAICLKALRKAPKERYADARELSCDLRAALDGRAVAARRGSRRYRWTSVVRRQSHRLSVAAALLVAAAALALAVRFHREASPVDPRPRPFPFSEIGHLELEDLRRNFAAAPESVETGATLALRLLREPSLDEAKLVLARLRQIPGQEQHPLIDYVESQVVSSQDEPHRALVYLTRARDRAIAAGRGDLLGQIRAARGRLLATLGRRAEAGAEMELALRDFAATADHASQARVLNDLAIERLQRGELAAGERLLERAIAEARIADNFPGTMLFNLACLQIVRGRPDFAEIRLRELVEARRASANRRQLGEALGQLARAVEEQGRAEEARTLLEEAHVQLRDTGSGQMKQILHLAGEIAVDRADLARLPALVAQLRQSSEVAGESLALALAIELEARSGGARGDLDAAGLRFAEARRLFTESGELDAAAECAAAEALAEIRAGRPAGAERAALVAASVLPRGAANSRMVALAQFVRVRALVASGRDRQAQELFARLPDGERSPAFDLRTAYLLARAALARSAGRFAAAKADLETVVGDAVAARRKLDELDAHLELAALESAANESADAALRTQAVAAEARKLGLDGFLERSRSLLGPARL